MPDMSGHIIFPYVAYKEIFQEISPFLCVILDMFVQIKLDIRVPMKTVNVHRSEGLFLWLARATTLTWTKRN